MKSFLTNTFWSNVKDPAGLLEGLQKSIESLQPFGIFAGDNLFAFGRNLSFLDDPAFMRSFEKQVENDAERGIIWRTHTLCWAAHRSLSLAGDFIEAGCYKGTSARIVCDYVDIGTTTKHFYLYDLFEPVGADHVVLPEHGAELFGTVTRRFADLPNVHVIRGSVPQILQGTAPDKISLLHLDMNNVSAEIGALDLLFERVTPGGTIILDDYGWLGYRAQKEAEDPFFAARGYRVLELPTGQGLVVK
jgi:hypothetical protein